MAAKSACRGYCKGGAAVGVLGPALLGPGGIAPEFAAPIFRQYSHYMPRVQCYEY